MNKFCRSRILEINAARKAARMNAVRREEKVNKVTERSHNNRPFFDDGPVEIPVNGYCIYHFPNLGLFIKAKYETWLTAKGYQPSMSSLMPVDENFVRSVLINKITGF